MQKGSFGPFCMSALMFVSVHANQVLWSRCGPVSVSNGIKAIHEGVMPESRIIELMTKAFNELQKIAKTLLIGATSLLSCITL